MSDKPKCDDIGFQHLWRFHGDCDRTCENCGKRERQMPAQWVELPYGPPTKLIVTTEELEPDPHGDARPFPFWKDR